MFIYIYIYMIYNFHYVRLNTPDLGPYLLSHFYLIYIYKQLTSYHLHLSLIVYFEYFHIFLPLGPLVLEQIDVWSPEKLFRV